MNFASFAITRESEKLKVESYEDENENIILFFIFHSFIFHFLVCQDCVL